MSRTDVHDRVSQCREESFARFGIVSSFGVLTSPLKLESRLRTDEFGASIGRVVACVRGIGAVAVVGHVTLFAAVAFLAAVGIARVVGIVGVG